MRVLVPVLCVLATAALAACSGDPSTDAGDTDRTGETGDTAATDTTDTNDTTPTEPTSATLSGTVTGPSGPVVDAVLRLCRDGACRNGTTDATGAYVYEAVAADWFAFEVTAPVGTTPALATAFAPLSFEPDQLRPVDVVLPLLDPPSPLGPSAEEHPVGEGLFVTLAAGDLEPPLFVDPAAEVAGAWVPEDIRLPTDGITGTVLGMWYVGPFDHEAIDPAGVPVRFVDSWGLADGTTLQCWVGSYEESAWLDCGEPTVSGGQITGASLPVLSTVVLVQP